MRKLQYKSVASTICTRKQQKHSKNLHDEEQTSPSIKKKPLVDPRHIHIKQCILVK